MPLTLSRQMKNVMHNGLTAIHAHQQEIQQKWAGIAKQLTHTNGITVQAPATLIDFFTEFLFSGQTSDIDDMLREAKDIWRQQYSYSIKPNHLIFLLTILENAIHEAMQFGTDDTYRKHQAIQYLFSQLSESLLMPPEQEQLDLDMFLEQLVTSQQLPIEWIAKLDKKGSGYDIKKLYTGIDQALPALPEHRQSDTIFSLSESLLATLNPGAEHDHRVFPLPYEGGTLLLGSKQQQAPYVLPFVTYALQVFKNGKDALKIEKQGQQWKDAVILFNELVIRSQTLREAIENITSGFVNFLPFERCALFSYSDTDQRGVGLFGHHLSQEAITDIQEDIKNLPIIYQNLQKLHPLGAHINHLQPIFISDASRGFPSQYVQQFELESVVIAPIFSPSLGRLMGAAILDQGPGSRFKVSRSTYTALMKFGQSAGEILSKFGTTAFSDVDSSGSIHLSQREVEVLRLLSEGASTSEAATNLHLSDYTVRDYVSAILAKLKAKNRTEAVAKAMRDNWI